MKYALTLLLAVGFSSSALAESPLVDVPFYAALVSNLDYSIGSNSDAGVSASGPNGNISNLSKLGFKVSDVSYSADSAKNCEIKVTMSQPKAKSQLIIVTYSSAIDSPAWKGATHFNATGIKTAYHQCLSKTQVK